MSPTYEPDLAAFLLSAFTTQELTALLAPLMPGVPARLPTAWVPPAQFAAEAARIVVGDGLATDPAFYAALTRERPRRAADVLALQDAAGVPRTGWRLEPPGGLPTPAPHPPVRGGRFVPVRVAGKGKTATVYEACQRPPGQTAVGAAELIALSSGREMRLSCALRGP